MLCRIAGQETGQTEGLRLSRAMNALLYYSTSAVTGAIEVSRRACTVRRSTQRADNQPRACIHPWLSRQLLPTRMHVALPGGIDSQVQATASSPYKRANIPDALYMEYGLSKRQPWRGGHLRGKVASLALVSGPLAVTKKVVKLFLGTCVDAMRFAAHFGAI